MKPIKLLIVDDEPLAHKVLEDYCAGISYVEVVGNCYDGVSILNFLHESQVDALLLDIEMPDLSGLEIVAVLQEKGPKVILTTAHTDYALQSFEYDQVIDYLHKPIRLTRFVKAIERLKHRMQAEENSQEWRAPADAPKEREATKTIHLKDNGTISVVELGSILYIQSWGNYLKVYLADQEVKISRGTMVDLEKLLPSHTFIRVHKSYLVNIDKIKSMKDNQLMLGSASIPIGKSYRLIVKKILA